MLATSSNSRSLVAFAAAAAMASASLVAGAFTCDTSMGSYYPYCVNTPDNASGKLPLILMLSGSGARNTGDSSKVKSLSGYDGVGKLVNQYLSGNKGADQTMAAEQFITVIPISPQYAEGGGEVRHWWPENLDKVLDAVSSKYPVDPDRIHCAGFSMGARGCWRYATARPGRLASSMSSAGAAEREGDGTLSQQKADAVFPLLKNIVNLPVWQFAGSSDTTAGTESPKATEAELKKLGSTVAQLTIENTDHSGLSTMPFNTQWMSWALKQTRSGGSSSSGEGTVEDVVTSKDSSASSTSSSVSGSQASATHAPTRQNTNVSTGKCKKRRAKRAVVHHPVVRRGLTLDSILLSTGRTLQPFNATVASSKSAAVVLPNSNSTTTTSSSNTIEKADNEKRGLSLAAIVSSRQGAKVPSKRQQSVQTAVERRAESQARSLPMTNAKMSRRMK